MKDLSEQLDAILKKHQTIEKRPEEEVRIIIKKLPGIE